jgi:PAS domain S-box-containing protein
MLSAFENAFTCAPVGMALVDLDGRLLRVNDALCRITGLSSDQLRGRPFRALSAPGEVDLEAAQNLDLLEGRLLTYQVEKRFQHAWGHSVWVLVSVSLVRDDDGQPRHLIAHIQDIAARKSLEGRLEELVEHDPLTGLFNGRRFEEALAQETRSVARYGGGGALMLIDLDHFKAVNDRFGHRAGDDLLKSVASTLRDRVRETDVPGRLGGDEFGIILPHVSAD